ncbi:MAG: pyruvate, phosphate dikinase [Candidatus Woesearchaeota archaeon]|nr:pyruvate, phosphate dikinase [Candidatus Woesearchaeota archaeon]
MANNTEKYVYAFEEGNAKMKDLLGGKGANLAEMTNLGIPVPPGFTITTEACVLFYKLGKKYPEGAMDQVETKLKELEKKTGKKFGDDKNPLLVSVRSGAKFSMPGMMDTILNLGINPDAVEGLSELTGNERFALDSYRRFIQMFGNVVLGVKREVFESVLDEVKNLRKIKLDTELNIEELKEIISLYKKAIKQEANIDFPEDPKKQLKMAIDSVFNSWNNERAITYRRLNDIPNNLGTAVNVQTMVFGNMGDDCGTGVAFTRNPSTGDNHFYGEYLMNAQGEDVVAGIRTPHPITDLKKEMPHAYKQLEEIYHKLEKHYKDMQDIEFTIETGKLYMLQTRNGKRTAQAAVKIAVDMVKEGLITKDEALMRLEPKQLDQLLHKTIDPKAKMKVIAQGLPASPGAAVGQAVFNSERAHDWAEDGKKVILVRQETSPEDIEGMNAAEGILTARGGMTSHAAVVARGMGKCCVSGCEKVIVKEDEGEFVVGGEVVKEGDYITLNGNTGEVILGKVPTVDPELKGEFKILMEWSNAVRKLKVRANADTPHDSEVARKFGAEGIGLTRTEHMFFQEDRIKAVREMILAETAEERKRALAKIEPMQKEDFIGIFKVMSGYPVTIRLLDPPLHEFLPKEEEDIKEIAKEMKVPVEKLKNKVISLHEFNPMLGFRGCRLGVVYPEISEMQVRAIINAAIEVNKKGGKAIPEIEIPVVGFNEEILNLKPMVKRIADELIRKSGVKVDYKIGTMIELPRACIVADDLAKEVEFFSFGTNDLTQTTLGFSRDDAGKFIPKYVEQKIFEKDPFQTIDRRGVGGMMKLCIEKGRKANHELEIGICGEHGGDPNSVEFCHELGLDYVSCSPFRVPIAILAAAQAALKEKNVKASVTK